MPFLIFVARPADCVTPEVLRILSHGRTPPVSFAWQVCIYAVWLRSFTSHNNQLQDCSSSLLSPAGAACCTAHGVTLPLMV